jgi:hypothetical protein
MIDDTAGQEPAARPLRSSFDRYLQDKDKGRGGEGGNYRRNAARELDRFAEWAAGERGDDDWTGITPEETDRDPTFADLDERVFREYARHLSGDRGLKQNTVQTYYAYISAWCGWCVNEGYLEAYYAQRASATAPLPEDNGRKPSDQQAWTPERRHALTRHVDEQAREAIEAYTTLPDDVNPLDKQRARYAALKAARDRALVVVLAYTAVRVGELLYDSDDPRRRGVRWEGIDREALHVAGIVRGVNASIVEPDAGSERQLRRNNLTVEVIQQNQSQATLRVELRDNQTGAPIALENKHFIPYHRTVYFHNRNNSYHQGLPKIVIKRESRLLLESENSTFLSSLCR